MGAPIEAGVWCYPTTSANSIVPVLSRYTFYVSGLFELHENEQTQQYFYSVCQRDWLSILIESSQGSKIYCSKISWLCQILITLKALKKFDFDNFLIMKRMIFLFNSLKNNFIQDQDFD